MLPLGHMFLVAEREKRRAPHPGWLEMPAQSYPLPQLNSQRLEELYNHMTENHVDPHERETVGDMKHIVVVF